MLDAIRSFLARHAPPDADGEQPVDRELHVAACALLLDIAYADGTFSDVERSRIEEVLGRQFGLDAAATQQLLELAAGERRQAIDHFHFTRIINERYDLGQKMVLAEVMWGVILADGQVAEQEAYLVRKIANLLEIDPGYLSDARKAARRRSDTP